MSGQSIALALIGAIAAHVVLCQRPRLCQHAENPHAVLRLSNGISRWKLVRGVKHVLKVDPRRRYLLSQMHLGSRAYVLLLHELARSAGVTQLPEPAAEGSPLLAGSDEL